MPDANHDHNIPTKPCPTADIPALSLNDIDPTAAQFDPTRIDDMDYIAAHLTSFGFAQGDNRRLHHLRHPSWQTRFCLQQLLW